jgi:hypothetical protein
LSVWKVAYPRSSDVKRLDFITLRHRRTANRHPHLSPKVRSAILSNPFIEFYRYFARTARFRLFTLQEPTSYDFDMPSVPFNSVPPAYFMHLTNWQGERLRALRAL